LWKNVWYYVLLDFLIIQIILVSSNAWLWDGIKIISLYKLEEICLDFLCVLRILSYNFKMWSLLRHWKVILQQSCFKRHYTTLAFGTTQNYLRYFVNKDCYQLWDEYKYNHDLLFCGWDEYKTNHGLLFCKWIENYFWC
jgi:hypothetical protein